MACYIVCFEAAQKNREALQTLIKTTYKSYCPVTDTCWAIITESKAAEVRDFLSAALSSTDRIFVLRSGTEAAWRNLYGPAWAEWLTKNL